METKPKSLLSLLWEGLSPITKIYPYGEYAVMRDGVLRSYNEMKTYAREFYEEDLLSLISYGVNSSEDEELREVGTELLKRVEEITGFIINM